MLTLLCFRYIEVKKSTYLCTMVQNKIAFLLDLQYSLHRREFHWYKAFFWTAPQNRKYGCKETNLTNLPSLKNKYTKHFNILAVLCRNV